MNSPARGVVCGVGAFTLLVGAFFVMGLTESVWQPWSAGGPGKVVTLPVSYLSVLYLTFNFYIFHALAVVLGVAWAVGLLVRAVTASRPGRGLTAIGVVAAVCSMAGPVVMWPQPVWAFIIAALFLAALVLHLLMRRFMPPPRPAAGVGSL